MPLLARVVLFEIENLPVYRMRIRVRRPQLDAESADIVALDSFWFSVAHADGPLPLSKRLPCLRELTIELHHVLRGRVKMDSLQLPLNSSGDYCCDNNRFDDHLFISVTLMERNYD